MRHIFVLALVLSCAGATPALAQHRPMIAIGAAIAGAGTVLALTSQAEAPLGPWRRNETTRRLERTPVPYTNTSRLVSGVILMASGATMAVVGVRHRATVAVSPSQIQVNFHWK